MVSKNFAHKSGYTRRAFYVYFFFSIKNFVYKTVFQSNLWSKKKNYETDMHKQPRNYKFFKNDIICVNAHQHMFYSMFKLKEDLFLKRQ